ncbi:MAG: leucyl/phenylalanyl-tRNA--protein transferase [Spirochaetota bacterium]
MKGRPSPPRQDPAFPRLSFDEYFPFPDPRGADSLGVVCSGVNLSPGLLLSAYRQGIFPWFNENEPLLWWSPDPRFFLKPEALHVSATMRKVLRRKNWDYALDRDFEAVIRHCSSLPRKRQRGTWITSDMVTAYIELHSLGFAHSVEVRLDERLVGGFYGVSLGKVFFGESMFSHEDDASKAAFIPFVWLLASQGFTLIDSQVYTDHLAGLGAVESSREDYLGLLAAALDAPTRRGNWGKLFPDFPETTEYRRVVIDGSPSLKKEKPRA